MVGVGEVSTVKFVDEVAMPPGALTVIGPAPEAPLGTVVLILMSEFTVKVGWLVPLKATAVAPVNPLPLITTGVPTGPWLGLKLLMITGGPVVILKAAIAPVHVVEALSVAP
jgi:hypothetical protein